MILQTDTEFWDIDDNNLPNLANRYKHNPDTVKLSDYGKQVQLLYIGGHTYPIKAKIIEEACSKVKYIGPIGFYKGQLLWYRISKNCSVPCEVIKIIPRDSLIEIRFIDQIDKNNLQVQSDSLSEKHIEN